MLNEADPYSTPQKASHVVYPFPHVEVEPVSFTYIYIYLFSFGAFSTVLPEIE